METQDVLGKPKIQDGLGTFCCIRKQGSAQKMTKRHGDMVKGYRNQLERGPTSHVQGK